MWKLKVFSSVFYMKNVKGDFFCPLLFPADAITLSSTCSCFSLLCSDRLEGKKELLALAMDPLKKKKCLLLCKGKVFKDN